MKVMELKRIIEKVKPLVVFLMETKQEEAKMIKIQRIMGYNNGMHIDPEGRSGGLAIWWLDKCKLEITRSSANIIDAMIEIEGV